MRARKIWCYYTIYSGYIEANNLPDDSGDISVHDIVSFVDDHIPEIDEREYYARVFEQGLHSF